LSCSKGSQNAHKHGLYSQDMVLDCENEQDFLDLWEAFRAEYFPQQVSEEAAVLEMAKLQWVKAPIGCQIKGGSDQAAGP
jgi:hypothetical protein